MAGLISPFSRLPGAFVHPSIEVLSTSRTAGVRIQVKWGNEAAFPVYSRGLPCWIALRVKTHGPWICWEGCPPSWEPWESRKVVQPSGCPGEAGGILPGFWSRVWPSVAVWPCMTFWTSLCLHFLICKSDVIIAPSAQIREDEMNKHVLNS